MEIGTDGGIFTFSIFRECHTGPAGELMSNYLNRIPDFNIIQFVISSLKLRKIGIVKGGILRLPGQRYINLDLTSDALK